VAGKSLNQVLRFWFWLLSSSPCKASDLWFLSDLLRSADFMVVVSLSPRRWTWGCFRWLFCFCVVFVSCCCCCFLLQFIDWVGVDLAILQWIISQNPKGSGFIKNLKGSVCLTRKGLFLTY